MRQAVMCGFEHVLVSKDVVGAIGAHRQPVKVLDRDDLDLTARRPGAIDDPVERRTASGAPIHSDDYFLWHGGVRSVLS
jgi:hypothetical protein